MRRSFPTASCAAALSLGLGILTGIAHSDSKDDWRFTPSKSDAPQTVSSREVPSRDNAQNSQSSGTSSAAKGSETVYFTDGKNTRAVKLASGEPYEIDAKSLQALLAQAATEASERGGTVEISNNKDRCWCAHTCTPSDGKTFAITLHDVTACVHGTFSDDAKDQCMSKCKVDATNSGSSTTTCVVADNKCVRESQ